MTRLRMAELQKSRSQQQGAQGVDSADGYKRDPVTRERILCCFNAFAAGFMMCFFLFMESLLVGADVFGIFPNKPVWWSGLCEHNPFRKMQWELLGLLAVGDLLFALAAGWGLILSSDAWMTPRWLWSYHAKIANNLVFSVVVWRIIVALATAPFVGVLMAFEPPGYRFGVFAVTMSYVAWSVVVAYTFVMVYRESQADSAYVQYALDVAAYSEWDALCEPGSHVLPQQVSDPTMLYCLDLEFFAAAYTSISALAFLYLGYSVATTGQTLGGWAFFTTTPNSSMMAVYEIVVYALSFCVSLIGFLAMYLHQPAWQHLVLLEEQPEDLPVAVHVEAHRDAKRSAAVALVYFLGLILRVSFFLPMTMMALVERNICDIYVRGLASTNLDRGQVAVTPALRCTSTDVEIMAIVLLVLLVELHLVTGIRELWHLYQRRTFMLAPEPSTSQYGSMSEAWDAPQKGEHVKLMMVGNGVSDKNGTLQNRRDGFEY